MTPWPIVSGAGAVVGALVGAFGVGGSSLATPLLALAGVPGLIAVASPLPATIPSALLASIPYIQKREPRPRAAAWTLAGAIPAAVMGAVLSEVIGGPVILVASGMALVLVGLRTLRPISQSTLKIGSDRRKNRPILVLAAAGVGLLSGLLANGGGFVLVPMYLLIFGLDFRQAVGTSLIVVSGVSLPTTITHAALGHIDWAIAAAFAGGMMPASIISARLTHRLESEDLRRSLGWFLIASGVAFTIYKMTRLIG